MPANRLIRESSPYLLQHAHNPVDWYPWGREAFEAARTADKPIFLSVGYSTCYWCHVMERECFENPAIAAEMNRRFISIKVDREQRPDIDQLYMLAVQVLNQQGGWPMSVFLTPDLQPFYGGTYFPPEDSRGRPGFPKILRAVDDAYHNRRSDIETTRTQLMNILRQLAEPAPPQESIEVSQLWVESLVERSTADYDGEFGGFGVAPKFPRETLLELLLEHNRRFPSPRRLEMVRHTLSAMADGGIRDQLAGAFHRYSTDAQWLVPHFEIMLYDNAMLGRIYADAGRQMDEPRFAEVARGIFDFVLARMTSPDGAFYTAFDAEADAQEGATYLWTKQEVEAVLGKEDSALFGRIYGLDRGPNFTDPHGGTGRAEKNVLYVAEQPKATDAARPAEMRRKLLSARDNRKRPSLDTKIITSWNALMIRALAYGGHLLREKKYVSAAKRAADWLLSNHSTPDGGLYRSSRDGAGKAPGFLDDYACLAQALLALAHAGAGEAYRRKAAAVAASMRTRFEDRGRGGFYFTDNSADDLVLRQKVGADTPLPSGNAVAAMVMLALDQPALVHNLLAVFAPQIQNGAESASSLVQAAMLYLEDNAPFVVEPAKTSAADRPMSPEQMAAGVVSVTPRWLGLNELQLRVSILRGFHINAHEQSERLTGTRVTIPDSASVASIDYPPGDEHVVSFSQQPLRTYSGEVAITIHFDELDPAEPLRLAFTYQACNDEACLPPVTKQVEVSRE